MRRLTGRELDSLVKVKRASEMEALSSHLKDPIRLWIEKRLEVGNLWTREKNVLLNIADVAHSLPDNVRHWFAGTAPLLPLTDPAPYRPGLSTALVRILMAAVVEKDPTASRALLSRADQLVASLHEKATPFDVVELATVLSEDDDELIVALDAILRMEHGIRPESPLHPTRLVLQMLQANAFNEQALLELLYDDESGSLAAFPMVRRLFEWAREKKTQWREVARTWRPCHIVSGGWRERGQEDEKEEEEESGSESPEREEEDVVEMEEPEEGCSQKSDPEPEPDDGYREGADSSAFLIRVVQMAGKKEEERVFLLPREEEPLCLIRPIRLSGQAADSWLQLLQMSRRLSHALQRHAKIRSSKLRVESRELADVINRFLE